MRGAARTAGAVFVSVALVLGIAALSRVPYGGGQTDGAVLRLSWRTRADEVRDCRRPTPEELASLPVHMRRPEVCEGRVLPRHLRVELDGSVLLDEVVRAAGARGDRPLYVYHEIPLFAGVHHLHVTFIPSEADSALEAAQRVTGAPPHLHLDTLIAVDSGEVALVTYDDDRNALVVRGPGTSAVP